MTTKGERYPLAVRFWRHVVCGKSRGDCWAWTGAQQPAGYGTIRVDGRSLLAHRVAYELEYGNGATSGHVVCHSCDNPNCVNPSHLWVGTVNDNNADRHAKRRSKGASHKGAQNPMSKLTPEDVAAIRSASGPHQPIADAFGITFQTVSEIRRRITWKHV